MLVAFAGVALLCAMDAAIKHGTLAHAVITVTFMRYMAGSLVSLPLFLTLRKSRMTRELLQGHALRGIVIAAAAFLFFFGLSVIPIAEAIAIAFIAPLLVPPIARVLLGERMKAINVIACAIGFLGVLVTVSGRDPAMASASRTEGIAAVLVSAVLYALSIVLLRQRALKDDIYVIGFLSALFPALYTAPFALALAPLPALETLPLFGLIGALGTGGMLMMAFAYARAEAQKLIVLEYTALGWAALLGWMVFDEGVRIEVVAGAAIVAGACLMTVWADHRRAVTA